MTNESGKKRRRKTPMEGFNNVPKMLAEARRLVDAATEADQSSGAAEPATAPLPMSAASEPATGTPQVEPTGPSQPPQKRRSPRSPRARPTPPQPQTAPYGPAAEASAAAPTPPKAGVPIQSRSLGTWGIEILHCVPGRTRLKIPMLKWNVTLTNDLMARLAMVPGILGVQASTVTGTAVFYYQPWELSQPASQQALQEAWQDLFPGVQPEKLTAALMGQREH